MRVYLLLVVSFLTTHDTYSMNHNGSDIESSDSDTEQSILYVTQSGSYYILMNLLLENKSADTQDFSLSLKVNDSKRFHKNFSVAPFSSEHLHVPAILELKAADILEFDFDTDGQAVKVFKEKIEYYRIPKNSAPKG